MEKITLLDYFEETARELEGRAAVLEEGAETTFGALRRRARALGCALRRLTGPEGKGRPVAVLLPKGAELAAADIAALYAGCPYLNLDPASPPARLEAVFRVTEPAAVIAGENEARAIAAFWPREKVLPPEAREPGREEEAAMDAARAGALDTDPLCLINTSGSTGEPKSVVLAHRGFLDYTLWAADTFALSGEETLGSLSPPAFDHFSYELCLMMVRGCALALIPPGLAAFPARLLQYVAERPITYLFWVPTVMVNIAKLDLLSRIPLPQVRLVWFAGEVFPTRQFNYWRRMLPGATFVNLYGPAEITVDCTFFIADREIPDEEPIPIGFPRRNTGVLLLDGDRPVEAGEEGEICVRGSALALGYYRRPELTAAVFTQNPLNPRYPERIYRTGDLAVRNERGELVFRGRRDGLVKHGGRRVELGEIEHAAASALGLVENCCAVYDEERRELVLFYESREELPPARLRKGLASLLPGYMVPGRFLRLGELPRNGSGKIDRLALKKLAAERGK